MNNLHYVYKPSVAHQLLQMNYVIKDVKPQKQEDGSIDYTRCVFLFEDKEGIEYAIKALTKSKKQLCNYYIYTIGGLYYERNRTNEIKKFY